MSGPATAAKKKKKGKKRGKTTGGPPPPPTPAPKPLRKDKPSGPPKKKPPKPAELIKRLEEGRDNALREVYTDPDERDSPGNVIAELAFDSQVLHDYAREVAKDASRLTPAIVGGRVAAFDKDMDTLTKRLAESRKLAVDVARIKETASKIGGEPGIDLNTDASVSAQWKGLSKAIAARGRLPLETAARIAEFEARLDLVGKILTDLNARRPGGTAAYLKIPDDLLRAAGTTDPLGVLRAGIPLEPDPATLRDLLAAADDPGAVPKLIGDSRTAGLVLADVLAECTPAPDPDDPPDTPEPTGDTGLAGRLIDTVIASGRPASFFLTGDGGRRMAHLKFAAETHSPLWAGATVTEAGLTLGPEGDPVTFDFIKQHWADPPEPGQPLEEADDGLDQYISKNFANNGSEQGMVLPRVTRDGVTIHYTEYDVRPYDGSPRGAERIVEGSDNRKYFTDDHYQTFKQIT